MDKKIIYIASGVVILLLVGGVMFAVGASWHSAAIAPSVASSTATASGTLSMEAEQVQQSQATATTSGATQAPTQSAQSGSASKAQQFQLQTECTAQAEKFLIDEEQADVGAGNSDYGQRNYYNASLGECFVLVDYSSTLGLVGNAQVAEDEELDDPYTNQQFALCSELFNTSDMSLYSASCGKVLDDGSMIAISYQDYQNFVSQKMGFAQ